MARTKKRATSGQVKNFITRSRAVRKLQISLPDFRRLCIFKGIYPREPRNKKKAFKSSTPSTTFYYTKDIQYLLHEPLLQKFRDHKALAKKIGRALGRGEVGDAARLERIHTPRITLDHIIKERYPTFLDALRDLDDALSMLFLFANLPSTADISPKTINICQRLCHEFQHYLIITHSLKKSFLSIKGIYYEATVQGQDILWVVPYKFVQRMTSDVDFRIMATFIEFYTSLMGFVNFRLYTSIGLIYPPKFDSSRDEEGAELGAFTLEGRDITNPEKQVEAHATSTGSLEATAKAQAAADALTLTSNGNTSENAANGARDDEEQAAQDDNEESNGIDTFVPTAPDSDALVQPSASRNEAGALFSQFTFFLSRETPRGPLEFLLKAFGCKRVGWDSVLGDGAFTHDESDPSITHQVVDRPPQPVSAGPIDEAITSQASSRGLRVPGRTYVQPQWVWDCINQAKLLRPDLYSPGATLPPHLSPWVKPKKGEYDPTAPLEPVGDDDEKSAPRIENGAKAGFLQPNGDDDQEASGEEEYDENEIFSDEDDADFESAEEEKEEEENGDFEGFDSDADADASEDEIAHARSVAQHQRELEAEAAGKPLSASSAGTNNHNSSNQETTRQDAAKRKQRRMQADAEELDRQKMMMPARKRKLLERMMYSNSKRDAETERLKAKRRRLESEKRAQ